MRRVLFAVLLLSFLAGEVLALGGVSGGIAIPYRKFWGENSPFGIHWNPQGAFGAYIFMTPNLREDQRLAMSDVEQAISILGAPELGYSRSYFQMRRGEMDQYGITDGKAAINAFTYTSRYCFHALTVASESFAWGVLVPTMGWGLYQFTFDSDADFEATGRNTLTELAGENKDLNFGYNIGLSTDLMWKQKVRITLGGEMHTIFKSITALYLPAPIVADMAGKRPRTRYFNLYVRIGLQ